MARSTAKPVTAKDRQMSQQHLRETAAMNKKHAADHMAASRSASGASATYNKAHAKAHKKDMKADLKMMKKRGGS